jgi:hypothetical protein
MRNLYAVRDVVADAFLGNQSCVMVFAQDAAAIRIFVDGLSNPEALGKHPDDYELVRLSWPAGLAGGTVEDMVYDVVLSGKAWRLSQEAK